MFKKIGTVPFFIGLAAMLASIALAAMLVILQTRETTQDTSGLIPAVKIGGPFTLVNGDGQSVSDADYRGQFMFMYFGFTYCPDVCPTELQNMSAALDIVEEDRPEDVTRIKPLFITIDPERDSSETVKEYVSHFYPSMEGLTGSSQQIAKAAKAYRVYYAKAESEEVVDYLMDHSSFVYLMGPDGKFVHMFKHNTPPEQMAMELKAALDKG